MEKLHLWVLCATVIIVWRNTQQKYTYIVICIAYLLEFLEQMNIIRAEIDVYLLNLALTS